PVSAFRNGAPAYRAPGGPGGGPGVQPGQGNGFGWFIAASAVLTALSTAAEAFLVIKAGADSGNAGLWDFSTASSSAHYHYGNTDTIYEDFGNASREGPYSTGSLTQWRLYNAAARTNDQKYRLDGTVIGSSAFAF